MSTGPFSQAPQPGDVIIRRTSDDTHRYIVGTMERRAQLICASRTVAVAHGTRYATAQGVRIWQVDDRERFTLVFDAPSKSTEAALS